ncbi:MAG: hypothetical protein NVSMB1_07210 [Polyangiales bacterium]
MVFLLWKMRPAGFNRRRPLDPRIREARDRASRGYGRQRALALCDAGAVSIAANRPTAAFGYYLRATRADALSSEPIRGIARALARRRRSLERVLWRQLSTLDWQRPDNEALRAALEELIALYRRSGERSRAEAITKALMLIPRGDSSVAAGGIGNQTGVGIAPESAETAAKP